MPSDIAFIVLLIVLAIVSAFLAGAVWLLKAIANKLGGN